MYGYQDKRLADALSRLPKGPVEDPLIDTGSDGGYKDSWRWPSELERFLRTHLHDDAVVVNAPAGASRIGDILIDADPQHDGVYMDDLGALSLPPNCADLVLSDIPWVVDDEALRKQWFEEVRRITKPEGRIIYNSGCIPQPDGVTLLDTRIRVDCDCGTASYLSLYRKDAPFSGEDTEQVQRAYRGVGALNHLREFGDEPGPSVHQKNVFTRLVQPALQMDSLKETIDPRALDPGRSDFNCPICENPHLEPVDVESFESILYECTYCRFRASVPEITSGRVNNEFHQGGDR